MHMAKRAIRRLAFIGWLGLVGMAGLPAHLAQAAAPPERVLPDTTLFLLKLNDVKAFREVVPQQPVRPALERPGLQGFPRRSGAAARRCVQGAQGADRRQLQRAARAPSGALAIAVLGRDDPKLPAAGVLIADAGENQKKLEEVFDRASKQAEEAGARSPRRRSTA